jgi:hypothetical protein
MAKTLVLFEVSATQNSWPKVLTGTGDNRTEIVPEQWPKISVALDNPETPSNTLWLTMLRSTQWVSTASCRVGGPVFVALEELGWATVREIAPCPEIQPGQGRVVTATFNHYGSNLLELRLEGQKEPLRPESRHPIFSETRQEWVRAGQMRLGELLRTANGPVPEIKDRQFLP